MPEFKGGTMDGALLSTEELQAIALLPSRDVLHGQLVGMLASPVTGIVRGLNQLIQGLALQLGQIAEQGLVSGDAPAAAAEPPAEQAPAPEAETPAATAEAPAADAEASATRASGDEPAENDDNETPAEGDDEAKEG